MYKALLDGYFASEEYAETEQGKPYLELTAFLREHLDDEAFLDFETILHTQIIHTAENAFIAGYTAKADNGVRFLRRPRRGRRVR